MSAAMDQSPLPTAHDVRQLVEGLLGRDVEVNPGGAVNPQDPGGAVVGIYVDDTLQLRSMIVLDLAAAAHTGAAIALVPALQSRACVEDGTLTPALFDNAAEILNVAASLFNADGAPHVRLYETYAPRETLPADVATWVHAYVRRLDLDVDVAGYGPGRVSVLAL